MARPSRRRSPPRRRRPLRVALIGLLLACAFAAAAIAGIMRVAGGPGRQPYRFPPPVARPAPD